MTDKTENVNNRLLITLIGEIRAGGAPVYIVDNSISAAPAINKGREIPKRFNLSEVAAQLITERNQETADPDRLATFHPGINTANFTRVIILHKEADPEAPENLTENAAHLAEQVREILTAANVKTYIQTESEATHIITATTNEEIDADIMRQFSARYSGAAFMDEFKAATSSTARNKAIPTGFKILDGCLDGGLYPGLYALGGGTGSGKTTFTLNLVEQLARQGEQVLFIALEMSRTELFAKIISNISVKTCGRLKFETRENGQKTRDVLKGGKPNGTKYDNQVLYESVEDFAANIAPNIVIHESIGTCTVEDIERLVKRQQQRTGRAPIVFVDYLQILTHKDPYLRSNDKAKTDANIVSLKQLSRDYNTPVFVVSSLNRESYKDFKQEVELTSFKESGAIEYTCDVVLGLQMSIVTDISLATKRDDKEQKKILESQFEAVIYNPEKRMDVKILKNRHGENKRIIRYLFTPAVNHFSEVKQVETRKSADLPNGRTYKDC